MLRDAGVAEVIVGDLADADVLAGAVRGAENFELSWSLERRQSLVDLGDATDVALAVLRDSAAHAGATYELSAPGRYTAHDLGRIISGVIDRPIEVCEIDAETFAARVLGGADPATMEYELRAMRAITAQQSRLRRQPERADLVSWSSADHLRGLRPRAVGRSCGVATTR